MIENKQSGILSRAGEDVQTEFKGILKMKGAKPLCLQPKILAEKLKKKQDVNA